MADPVCVFCECEIDIGQVRLAASTFDPVACPHCGKPAVLRCFGAISGLAYCQGLIGGTMHHALFASDWSPDELEAIAKDLRKAEQDGLLRYSDGSGQDLAGRVGKS